MNAYILLIHCLLHQRVSDIVTAHSLHITQFRISVEPKQDKVLTMYWLRIKQDLSPAPILAQLLNYSCS
jgi:hypothetical protein